MIIFQTLNQPCMHFEFGFIQNHEYCIKAHTSQENIDKNTYEKFIARNNIDRCVPEHITNPPMK